MAVLEAQAGNAAELAEQCKELTVHNKAMTKELDGVAEKFREE